MKPKFREDKATQAACVLISREGGTINYMKLLKLMYLADRHRLLARGRPITFDDYYSLDHGPILSRTKNLIVEDTFPGLPSVWAENITVARNYTVSLAQECPAANLSEAEIQALNEVYDEFGHMDQWELRDWCHDNLPEWQYPHGSAIPIQYHDILIRGGKTETEAAEIESEINALAAAEAIFSA